ncbi:excitatory amino acid transporter 3 [Biomphalaria pfeifferi]|uniref:Amino acid transporter n=1 Tax=Biomphalaria pfeifferi TaxID=112525 RepID=A0AAD8FKJ8_BIOPF|nr:excitatory amino acid transporter 3 [Biomphalaria pfeifferi]
MTRKVHHVHSTSDDCDLELTTPLRMTADAPNVAMEEPQKLDIKEKSFKRKVGMIIKQNGLILATFVGIILGFCLGLGLRELEMSDHALMWLGLPGELFLRCLKATIVPLVVTMVITCTATLDPRSNGKIAVVALLGFFLTQVVACTIAIVMFFIFKPDGTLTGDQDKKYGTDLETQDVFADLFRNFFPDNVVGAAISQTVTVYEKKESHQIIANSTNNVTKIVVTLERSIGKSDGMNILGLITICTAIGIAANATLSVNSEFLRFFKQAQDVMFVIIRWLFWTTPIGVLSLIAKSIAAVDDIAEVFRSLGLLVGAVIVGLAIHLLIVLPAVYFLLTRKNPYLFLIRCIRPFIVAFAATATSVAMPDMLTSADKNNVAKHVSAFVIPMSVTLHADGSALYITSSVLFLAQTSSLGVSVGDIVVTGILSSVLSLAIPPVPSSSIVTLIIIMTSLNIPLQGVALLFAVEWLLDRFRSGVNAISHVMVAAFTSAICGSGSTEQLEQNIESPKSTEIVQQISETDKDKEDETQRSKL